MKPRMSAAEAGRKGGKSRSAAKLAAARANGFQKGLSQADLDSLSTLGLRHGSGKPSEWPAVPQLLVTKQEPK